MKGRYLLDTHTLLYAIARPHLLSAKAFAVIHDPLSSLFASSASAWEIATKYRLGRLPQAEPLIVDYPGSLARIGAVEVPITNSHALLAGSFDEAHRDPFDRILAAQARLEGMTIVSKDAALDAFGARRLW
ncbi:type II toxin-antitoxin system VapC family toxin [Oceanithermus desulfurans]|uniref:Twitching motility protein PilT n=2 Tax=Oceanithermus desulfurans TaxID=227924 RepID=A0A511RLG8_9DEIN|nr:type II toxin-antitoxin system VapC family toxin [Oceanithermus desulfurans]MBB6028984.1 PIN domain nuclease of toxin-antitoxin system [Oceanithermus desulfurans]GEM90503.1 twitching motility protein PilT [Oceanithermus desulfurans NBRC 100063]